MIKATVALKDGVVFHNVPFYPTMLGQLINQFATGEHDELWDIGGEDMIKVGDIDEIRIGVQ